MKNTPIGVFDSGVGGLTIWREICNVLPKESTIYFADSKNAPYGEKDRASILKLSIACTEFLLEQGCKMIVVACNTATTNAIKYLRDHYPIPFIGIEPAIRPASLQTKTGIIGVLATKQTLISNPFSNTSSSIASQTTIVKQVGEGLVSLIEAGKINSQECKILLQKYLTAMLDKNIDCLVLGCSHYPHLTPLIKTMIPKNIQIVDSSHAVVKQIKRILQVNNLLKSQKTKATHTLFTNKNISVLKGMIPTSENIKVKRQLSQINSE